MSDIWMPKEEAENWKKLHEEWLQDALWGTREKRIPKYEDDLKFAWVEIIDGEEIKREMLFVNNKDMKAYKTVGYNYVTPLEEVKYNKFERWCTGFDL